MLLVLYNMTPKVADELAELRSKGTVKSHAINLTKTGGSLSTPEAEAAALRAKKEQDKLGSIKAKEILTRGGSGYSQEIEHTLNQTGKKKAELEKKNEAKKILSKASGTVFSASAEKKRNNAPTNIDTPGVSTKEEPGLPDAEKKKSSTPMKLDAPAEDSELAAKKKEPTPFASAEKNDDHNVQTTPTKTTTDDDVPELEEVDDVPNIDTDPQTGDNTTMQQTAQEEENVGTVKNRNEKKARKMMGRLGMRPVPNIARCTFKANAGRGYFAIDKPDVFVSTNETYVIFGVATQGGSNPQSAAQQQAAAMAAANAAGGGGKVMDVPNVQDNVPEPTVEEGEGDETGDVDGIEEKDIGLVMSQASCSRAKAILALQENDGDLVNAIMSLTT